MELNLIVQEDSSPPGQPVKKKPRVAGSRPNERPSYPRKRAVQACRTCRLRRTKCDNSTPSCSSCVDLGVECIYAEKDASTFDAASLAILQRIDGLEELIRSTSGDPAAVRPLLSSTSASVQRTPSQGHNVMSPSDLFKQIGSPSLERVSAPDVSYQIDVETILSWPVFSNQNLESHLDLKALLQTNTSYDFDPSLVYDTPDLETIDALDLLDHYIKTVHIYNPVLEEAKIRDLVQNSRLNGLGWDASSCLLLLIYAIGSAAKAQAGTSSSSSFSRHSQEFFQAEAHFHAAQKRMGALLCKTGATEAQCFFLAGVYQMCILRPIEAWRMFVQALSCCQGLSTDTQNEQECQLQESIYWTCFKSELELRLNLNLSHESVWDLTYPAFFPSPPKSLKSQGEVVWYFYLAEIALRRLGNRILNYIYSIKAGEPPSIGPLDAVKDFEAQAKGWLASLPPSLKLNTEHPPLNDKAASEQHIALRFILHGHLLDCYEMMYWPFIVDAIHSTHLSSSRSYNSQEPGLETYISRGLHLCSERVEKNEAGFQGRHHGTWLMLRSCTRSALVLVAAARSQRLGNLLPEDWRQSVEKVIGLLKYWKDESRDVADRLVILERQMISLTTGAGT